MRIWSFRPTFLMSIFKSKPVSLIAFEISPPRVSSLAICYFSKIYKTRSLGALRPPTSTWRPFGPLDFVLRALRALRPCDPRKVDQYLLFHLYGSDARIYDAYNYDTWNYNTFIHDVCIHDAYIHYAGIHDECIHDACIHDACIHDACIHDA